MDIFALQVKIRGETLQLRNAWRRVTQRLPEDRAAASTSSSAPATSSSSGDADAAANTQALADAAVSQLAKQTAGPAPEVQSASESRSSQATATVSTIAEHPTGDGVRSGVPLADAGEVEQPVSRTGAAQQRLADVSEPEPDAPEPPHKRAKSAKTRVRNRISAARAVTATLDGAGPVAAGGSAAASELTLAVPPSAPPLADGPLDVAVTLPVGESQPTPQRGNVAPESSNGDGSRAASLDGDAGCMLVEAVEPSQAEATCITPVPIQLKQAVLTAAKPSALELEIAEPSKVSPQHGAGRRRGKACPASPAEPQQPATPAAGAAQKAKRKRKRKKRAGQTVASD